MVDTDHRLLREFARAGSESAFRKLVDRNLEHVYSVALRVTRNESMAEDVAQHVFVALATQAKKLTGSRPLQAWLHVTTRRRAIDLVRSENARRRRENLYALEMTMTEETATWQEIEPVFDELIESLRPTDQQLIVLRYFRGLSNQELAEEMGIGVNTVRVRVQRAVDRLRLELSRKEIATTSSALALAASAHASTPSPELSAEAIAGSALSTHIPAHAITTLATFAMTKIKITLITMAAVGLGSLAGWQISQNASLQAEDQREREPRSSRPHSLGDSHQPGTSLQARTALLKLLEEGAPLNIPFADLERLAGRLDAIDLRYLLDEVGFKGASGTRGWLRCALYAHWGRTDPEAPSGLDAQLEILASESILLTEGRIKTVEGIRPFLGQWYSSELNQACFSLFRGRMERQSLHPAMADNLLNEMQRYGTEIQHSGWVASSVRFLFSKLAGADPAATWEVITTATTANRYRHAAQEGFFKGLEDPTTIDTYVQRWEPRWRSDEARNAHEAFQRHIRSNVSFHMPSPPEEAIGLEAALAIAQEDLQSAADWITQTGPAGEIGAYSLYREWASRNPAAARDLLADPAFHERRHVLAEAAMLANPFHASEIVRALSDPEDRRRVLKSVIMMSPSIRREDIVPTPASSGTLPDHHQRRQAILQAIDHGNLPAQETEKLKKSLHERYSQILESATN